MAALSTDSSADEDSDVSDGDSYADADAKAYSTTDTKRQKRDLLFGISKFIFFLPRAHL